MTFDVDPMTRKYQRIRLGLVVSTIMCLLGWRISLAADSELTQATLYKLPDAVIEKYKPDSSGSRVYGDYYVTVSGTRHQYISTDAGQKTSPFVLELNGIAREDVTEATVLKLLEEGWTWAPPAIFSRRHAAIDGPNDVKEVRQFGENAVRYKVGDDQSYTLHLRTSPREVITLEIHYGKRNPESATFYLRYNRLFFADGIDAQLTLGPEGVTPVLLDKDGDGTYETPVEPTSVAIGKEQVDVTPPKLSYEKKRQGGETVISLSATDEKSGVVRIHYTSELGGWIREVYLTPIRVPTGKTTTVVFYAEDNAGNRTTRSVEVY